MIFTNGTIITMDPQRRIIADGAVAVRGDRIAAVGKTAEVLRAFPDEERLDVGGKVVMPGLIDCHVHLAQALIRGCADDLSLIRWLTERVWVLQGNYTPEDGRASAELCILEMLKSGTTTFLEVMIAGRYGFDGIAEAVRDSGIRGVLSKIVMDLPAYAEAANIMYPGMIEEREATIREALDMHDKWDGQSNGRIRVWFGPRTPGGCTPDLYREVSQLARERGMGITVHLAEVREDVEYTQKEFGLRPVDFAEEVGLLGPNVVLAHAVWLTDEEIEKLAQTGTHVCHNPSSNMKLASGFAKVPEMLQAGVNVALGCDGGPSNNTYDMIREMRLASYIHKGRTLDPTVMPAERVLEMATINGAKALGMADEIGSLEVGKKADLVVLDLNKAHIVPSPDPVSAIVCTASGGDVDTVVIDGRVVVRGGEVLTMDEERVLDEARDRAQKVYQRAGIEIAPRWPLV
jgi:cytosine/adenosine deaminase-related metal-dependent hydrolase